MLRARTRGGALLHAHDQWRGGLAASDIADVRSLIDELIDGHEHEVGPHDLRDRLHAAERGAQRAAEDRVLRDGSVEYTVIAELFLQASGDAEDSTGLADVLAEYDHSIVLLELRP